MTSSKSATKMKTTLGISSCAVAFILLVGCGKKEAPVTAQPVETRTAEANQAAPPTPDSPAPTPINVAEVQAATKAGKYDQAVQMLVDMQHNTKQMTPQQSSALQNQMRLLQADIATAVANGDPKAKAAADALRRASMH